MKSVCRRDWFAYKDHMPSWNLKKKYWAFVYLFALIYTFFLGALGLYLWTGLDQGLQEQLKTLLVDNFGAIFVVALCVLIGQLLLLNEIFQSYILPFYNLEEEVHLIARANPRHRIHLKACKEIQDIASSVNMLAQHLQDVQEDARQGLREQFFLLEKEKDLYLGIINDLPLAAIACSDQGEILAYNKKASSLFTPAGQDQKRIPSCSYLGVKKNIQELINKDLIGFLWPELKERIAFSGADKVLEFTCNSQKDTLLYMYMVPLWREQVLLGYILIGHDFDKKMGIDVQHGMVQSIWPRQLVSVEKIMDMVGAQKDISFVQKEVSEEFFIYADIFLLQKLICFLVDKCHNLSRPGRCLFATTQVREGLSLQIFVPKMEGLQESLDLWKDWPLIDLGEHHSPLLVHEVLYLHGMDITLQESFDSEYMVLRCMFQGQSGEGEKNHWDIRASNGVQFSHLHIYQPCHDRDDFWDRELHEHTYTVFDCETTGLNPQAGDEVISISAVRIVHGKVQLQEIFNQLVNPQRLVPEESIQIHGIRPEMLEGQPTITDVLPLFQRFVQGTVLVAHNAAFDMQFLNRKEKMAKGHLRNVVLDTAKLSYVLMPHQKDHGLDAVAKRFGVRLYARHTSLGDAMTAAEVFLALLPFLKYKGITTLRQAVDQMNLCLDSGPFHLQQPADLSINPERQ